MFTQTLDTYKAANDRATAPVTENIAASCLFLASRGCFMNFLTPPIPTIPFWNAMPRKFLGMRPAISRSVCSAVPCADLHIQSTKLRCTLDAHHFWRPSFLAPSNGHPLFLLQQPRHCKEVLRHELKDVLFVSCACCKHLLVYLCILRPLRLSSSCGGQRLNRNTASMASSSADLWPRMGRFVSSRCSSEGSSSQARMDALAACTTDGNDDCTESD